MTSSGTTSILFCNSTEKISYCLKIYKVELWKDFPLSKAEVDHKFFSFGYKSSNFRTNIKYKSNNKVKSPVKIHVGNEFDM